MGESAVTKLIRYLFIIGSAGAFGYSIYTNILQPTQPYLYALYPPLYMWDQYQNWEMAFMVLGLIFILGLIVSFFMGRRSGTKKTRKQIAEGGIPYW